MNYPHESISTVQLSPFGEEEWNRIATYSPMYVQWTDLVMMSEKRSHKPILKKRNLLNSIDMSTIKIEDEILLNELHDIRRSTMPSMTTLKEKNFYHESKFLDEEHDRRPTSPTDEYQRSTDIFYQTREPIKSHSSYIEPSYSNQQYTAKHSQLQPQTSNVGPIKTLPNINLGPKPQASLSVQLQQSTIVRQYALATTTDHRSSSTLSMLSTKRAAGGPTHLNRRNQQQCRTLHSQTPPLPTETNVIDGFSEQLTGDLSSSIKKPWIRSTNTSRSTMHKVKTKNDRARKKQHIELKTILVKPCRQPTSNDGDLQETIPNSIEIMRKFGGPITAFEKNLRYTYNKQLNQFRNDSTKY